MVNLFIKMVAFPALCLFVAFGGAGHAQGLEVDAGPGYGSTSEAHIPQTSTSAFEWTGVIITGRIQGYREHAIIQLPFRTESACDEGVKALMSDPDPRMGNARGYCVSVDGHVRTYPGKGR